MSAEEDLLRALARDWASIWQSELAAIAADPELIGYHEAATAAWLAAHSDAGSARPSADRNLWAWPATSPRSAPADAASDARDAAVERLHERLAELERRLDRLGA